ncbi:MAG: hypothetical protein IPN66_05325 [Candidatus Competibacteraceae bacterium]|nr:hypothetical protein [Candidatus Competibacteraceae bacterium]
MRRGADHRPEPEIVSEPLQVFRVVHVDPDVCENQLDRPRGGPVDERLFARPDMIRQRPLQVGDIDFDRADRAGQQINLLLA